MFRKPGGKKTGLKFLVIGRSGVGKTVFALSAPKVAILDAETGAHLYEDKEEGRNLVGVSNTQSFEDLAEALEEILEDHEDMGVESVVIDSETKFFNDINQTVIYIEEKKAKAKGKDPLDSQLSIRSYGIIGRKAEELQNLKIDVSAAGVNVISIAQETDVTKFDMKSGTSEVIGTKPKMKKEAEFDYDIVLTLFTEGDVDKGEEVKYFAKVNKDRSKTFKRNDIIENPTFDLWRKTSDSMKDKSALGTTFAKDGERSREEYQKEVEEEDMTIQQRIAKFVKVIKEEDAEKFKEFQEGLKELGIKSVAKMTAKQEQAVVELMKEFSK